MRCPTQNRPSVIFAGISSHFASAIFAPATNHPQFERGCLQTFHFRPPPPPFSTFYFLPSTFSRHLHRCNLAVRLVRHSLDLCLRTPTATGNPTRKIFCRRFTRMKRG